MSRKKHSFLERLWLLTPIAIWFSYQPLICLARDDTMNYELSLTMIFLLILVLASLPIIWRKRRELLDNRAVWLAVGFFTLSTISLFWTMNLARGILSTGVLGMLFLAFLGAASLGEKFKKLIPKIIKIYIISSVVACGLAIVQFFAGIWLKSDLTLLCAGCVVEQFGFVRPNLFMIEPQFFASALLPAGLILTHQLIIKNKGFSWRVSGLLALVAVVLILTLSRGAIFAFAFGVLFLFVLRYRKFTKILAGLGIFATSLIIALGLQGLVGVINPKIDGTFLSTVSRSVNQLSMGLIDLAPEPKKSAKDVKITTNNNKKPNFDGYIEESTSARTTRTAMSIDRWNDDLTSAIFGTGVGSSGAAIHQKFPEKIGAREIVQNEYVEILLEKGIIGLVAFLSLLASIFWLTRRQKWLWSILLAFMIQWNFFSGYPNALHIYLALIIIGGYFILHRGQSKPAMQY